MKKYLYLICLLCCCAFVSNMQVVSAQSSAPYVRVGLLQGVQEIVITAMMILWSKMSIIK